MMRGYEQDEKLFSDRALEDEFTSWVIVLTSLPVPLGALLQGIVVDNDGYMLVWDNTNGDILSIDRNGTVTTYAGRTISLKSDFHLSHTHKYFLNVTIGGDQTFEVYRHSILRFERNVRLDHANFDEIEYDAISPNGRFLAFIIDDLIAPGDYVALYEGR